MKTSLKMIAASLALIAGQASASPITVAGVTWDPDSPFDFSTTDTMFETAVSAPGDILRGYGRINEINGDFGFCSGCELTYTFTYTLASVSPTQFRFTGGVLNIFADSTPNFNSLLQSTATDGVSFLTLAGHTHLDIFNPTLPGTLFSTPTPFPNGPAGNGRGMLDVTGGLAAGNFDTNTVDAFQGLDANGDPIFDKADFSFTSSFQRTTPFVSDDGVTYSLKGSNDIQGNSIPEPGSMALLGLGLVGLGALRRRKAS